MLFIAAIATVALSYVCYITFKKMFSPVLYKLKSIGYTYLK